MGPVVDPALCAKLARAMTAPEAVQQDGRIGAAFTYLGQFVDHDLTMDRTAAALGEDITLPELIQGRSPTLDLDSLYGPRPALLRARRRSLRMGRTAPAPGFDGLPRRPPTSDEPAARSSPTIATTRTAPSGNCIWRSSGSTTGWWISWRMRACQGRTCVVLTPDTLISTERDNLLSATPLWFYIFRESELNDGLLDGVGARIMADVFHRSIEASHHSMIRDPAWRPSLGPDSHTFRIVDLLLHAFEANADLLNPVDAEPVAAIRRRRRLG
ncbi:hypothetical protein GCM10009555_019020 [Acrocarpospora macrocephala]|uniref:Heme peroxidase n=1 Tax=Acrocarpospora macrocephala TaxID=150177 RepID=A0A5M3WHF5_9ACTN|nr:hypothetical protein [Acrocarpospora macrocephala]GES07562.1 hypothetical protein Amac_011570 [Acrocarpospora macrocephala]